jgi:diguanylate cyclase (GGDEF)-like protein
VNAADGRAGATLLLIDDDEMNRDALSRRLERAGYEVITANGGERGLELLHAHRIDAVLLDIMMPGMSGIETLRRIRDVRPLSELPVIMVTAKDASDDVVEALDLGANDYVTKPVNFATALARIRAQVATRRADPLTGLANRVLFMDRLDRLVARNRTHSHRDFAVFFLDVDRFKIINDSLGHVVGDELLLSLARRLENALRVDDVVVRSNREHTLARLGGDEFTILLDGINTAAEAQAIASRLLEAAAHPFQLQGREVFTSVSIGIVMSAPRYQLAGEMVRDADTAMYQAKALGKARCEVFNESMLAAAERRLQLESELRRGLERKEFRVHYQPIVELRTGTLTGFEALLRWQHPERGLISPGEFIPTAEETGLIVPIGNWALGEACRQMRAWDAEFGSAAPMIINVNLSAKQCMHPDLLSDVSRILKETGLPPSRLKLEITETVLLEHSDEVRDVLDALRAMGVQLGLDDFGMGYSSLSYLQKYPFQTLKIDRSFVSRMEDPANAEIVRAIIALAAGLAMNVTAEGVETPEQLAGLQELSCQSGQGFYFAKPLVSSEASALLADRAGNVGKQRAS